MFHPLQFVIIPDPEAAAECGEYSCVSKILTECHIHLVLFKGERKSLCLAPLRKVSPSIYLCLSESNWKRDASLSPKGFFLFHLKMGLLRDKPPAALNSCAGASLS